MATFTVDLVEDRVKTLIFYLEDKIKLVGSAHDKITHIEVRDDQLFPDAQAILDILEDEGAVEIYTPFTYMRGLHYRLALVNIDVKQLKKVKGEYYKKFPGTIISSNDVYVDADKMGIKGDEEKPVLRITYDEINGRIILNDVFVLKTFQNESNPKKTFCHLYKNPNRKIQGDELSKIFGATTKRIKIDLQELIRDKDLNKIFFNSSEKKGMQFAEFRNPITVKQLKEIRKDRYISYVCYEEKKDKEEIN